MAVAKNRKSMTLHGPKDLYKEIKKLSIKERRSMSMIMIMLMEEALESRGERRNENSL